MNRLEINPDNEKYYSKEFIQGYKCGTKSQFDEDVEVLDKISQEIKEYYINNHYMEKHYCTDVLEIVDKYR